jgi:hypothetical protein
MAFGRRKYGNKVFENAEGKFDGKNEWLRWCFLKDAQNEGTIRNLRRQVEFELIPRQEHQEIRHLKTKDKVETVFDEHPVRYLADFVYEKYVPGDGLWEEDRWVTVVEDFKGMKLPDYIIKRKLMLYLKHIKIREVKKPAEII